MIRIHENIKLSEYCIDNFGTIKLFQLKKILNII